MSRPLLHSIEPNAIPENPYIDQLKVSTSAAIILELNVQTLNPRIKLENLEGKKNTVNVKTNENNTSHTPSIFTSATHSQFKQVYLIPSKKATSSSFET